MDDMAILGGTRLQEAEKEVTNYNKTFSGGAESPMRVPVILQFGQI